MKKLSVFCLVFVAFFSCIFLSSCRYDVGKKIREIDKAKREKIIKEATINFGIPITSGNHTWIPINKRGHASDYAPEIIDYLNNFEEKNGVEIISKDIEERAVDSTLAKIYGIWLIHKPKSPATLVKERVLKEKSAKEDSAKTKHFVWPEANLKVWTWEDRMKHGPLTHLSDSLELGSKK
jgi:hypothetical protein